MPLHTYIYIYVYIYIYTYMCNNVCLSIYLSIYLSTYLSIYRSVHLSSYVYAFIITDVWPVIYSYMYIHAPKQNKKSIKAFYPSVLRRVKAAKMVGALEQGCRIIYAGVPSVFGLGLEDGHVPTFCFCCGVAEPQS